MRPLSRDVTPRPDLTTLWRGPTDEAVSAAAAALREKHVVESALRAIHDNITAREQLADARAADAAQRMADAEAKCAAAAAESAAAAAATAAAASLQTGAVEVAANLQSGRRALSAQQGQPGCVQPLDMCVAGWLTRVLCAPGRRDGRGLLPSRLCRWKLRRCRHHHQQKRPWRTHRRWHPPRQRPVGARRLPGAEPPAPAHRPPRRRRPRKRLPVSSLRRRRSPLAVVAAGLWRALKLALRVDGNGCRLTWMTSRRTGVCGHRPSGHSCTHPTTPHPFCSV